MSRYFTTLAEAEAFLLRYSPEKLTGETYTLDRMRLLMDRLGNPQNDIPVIHVAGTSGKTSTSYFIRALLEARGKKTGLTASPHIDSITERVQIGGMPLAEDAFISYLQEFITIIKPWNDMTPTYFELLVAFAFWVFKQERVDYMVVEVGLGGLLDATNVIANQSKVAVITPIGLDHTQILGETIEAIAKQKAGIITQGLQVFSASQVAEAASVIQAVCKNTGSILTTLRPVLSRNSDMPLFQQANFELARQVADFVARRDGLRSLTPNEERLCTVKTPPGRFEIYIVRGKTVILDGAHNPQKLAMFKRSLQSRYPNESFTWLIGFIAGPNEKIEASLGEIIRVGDEYTFTDFTVGQDFKGRESVASAELANAASAQGVPAVSEADAFRALESVLASKKRTVVITGSLYLIAKLGAKVRQLAD